MPCMTESMWAEAFRLASSLRIDDACSEMCRVLRNLALATVDPSKDEDKEGGNEGKDEGSGRRGEDMLPLLRSLLCSSAVAKIDALPQYRGKLWLEVVRALLTRSKAIGLPRWLKGFYTGTYCRSTTSV